MKLRQLLTGLSLGIGVLHAGCSAAPDDPAPAGRSEAEQNSPSAGETTIAIDAAGVPRRDCTLTIAWKGGGNAVAIAGEFSGWSQLPMMKTGGVHQITLSPGAGLEAGKVIAYKVVVDGNWRLDPLGKYRKIVGGNMNSGLVMPSCAAGPEVVSGKVDVLGGAMNVRLGVKAAADGVAASRVVAKLDGQALPAGSFQLGADGAITVHVEGLEKGKHRLSAHAVDAQGRVSEPIDLPFWVEDEPFSFRDGILYMVLLDRFANGERGNDRPVGGPVHYDADWHGGDLQGALEVLESGYFEKLGVRTIWLSPLNRQTDNWHVGDGNQLFSAYHGYWPVRGREVEPRFGGDRALRAFVAAAHRRGIRVLLDLINNQVHEDHEYVSAHPDWFRTACKCGEPGCGWSEKPFECMFQPYLPDIDWNRTGAEKQFIADAVSWISEFDLDGFRVDAVKHVEANSVYNMRAELTRRFEQGGARIFMAGETAVGEYDSGTFFGESFSSGYDWIDAYTGPTALDGQFDFPTRHNMADGLANGDKPLNEVEDQLKKAETRYRPDSLHVRFLNGHDNPRIASIAAKDPKLGCSWLNGCRDEQLPPLAYSDPAVYAKMKRALTVLYTMPGVPYLYQGDEVAFGGGSDPDMRRNMLFGGALEGVEMAKPGAEAPSLTAAQVDLRTWVEKLGKARGAAQAIRRGQRVTLLGNDANLWVYAYQTSPSDLAVVVVNRGGAVQNRAVRAAGLTVSGLAALKSALGTGAVRVQGGDLSVTIGAGEAGVFVP